MSTEHGSKIKFKVRYVASCTTPKVMKHQTRRGKTLKNRHLRLLKWMWWQYQYFIVLGEVTYVKSGTCSSSPKEYTRDSPTEACCAFRGWPLPRIIWRKNKPDAKLIVNNSDGFSLSEMLEGNGTLRSFLRISKSKEKHERDYECIAENSIPGWPSPEPVIFELSLQCEWGPEGAGHSL